MASPCVLAIKIFLYFLCVSDGKRVKTKKKKTKKLQIHEAKSTQTPHDADDKPASALTPLSSPKFGEDESSSAILIKGFEYDSKWALYCKACEKESALMEDHYGGCISMREIELP